MRPATTAGSGRRCRRPWKIPGPTLPTRRPKHISPSDVFGALQRRRAALISLFDRVGAAGRAHGASPASTADPVWPIKARHKPVRLEARPSIPFDRPPARRRETWVTRMSENTRPMEEPPHDRRRQRIRHGHDADGASVRDRRTRRAGRTGAIVRERCHHRGRRRGSPMKSGP